MLLPRDACDVFIVRLLRQALIALQLYPGATQTSSSLPALYCRRWASIVALLLAVLLLFGALLTAAERFFCPALELISDYLRLPPALAGATLLSFGNGAPDVFTQLAAITQASAGPQANPATALCKGSIIASLAIEEQGAGDADVCTCTSG